jgi:hypothetical protein
LCRLAEQYWQACSRRRLLNADGGSVVAKGPGSECKDSASSESKSDSFALSIVHLNMLNWKLLVEDKYKHITEMTSLLTAVRNKLPLCVREKHYG